MRAEAARSRAGSYAPPASAVSTTALKRTPRRIQRINAQSGRLRFVPWHGRPLRSSPTEMPPRRLQRPSWTDPNMHRARIPGPNGECGWKHGVSPLNHLKASDRHERSKAVCASRTRFLCQGRHLLRPRRCRPWPTPPRRPHNSQERGPPRWPSALDGRGLLMEDTEKRRD